MSDKLVTEEQVLDALRSVMDPDLHRDIVELGFVRDINICGGAVKFRIVLTTPACPVRDQLKEQARRAVMSLPGVEQVNVEMDAEVPAWAKPSDPGKLLPQVSHVVAVASGKGGVGKSTIAVNLAATLAREGARVGLVDADIYGPSVPTMVGALGLRPAVTAERKVLPIERHGIKTISFGYFIDLDRAAVWRGPMVASAVRQFLSEVEWGELDYLVVDLPPGTGDAPMTIAQSLKLTGAVIVTTPQKVAVQIARKALSMMKTIGVPVLGIIENMSWFVAPDTGKHYPVFGEGGGEEAAREAGVPLLGQIPLMDELRQSGDRGVPLVVSHPEHPAAQALIEATKRMAAEISKLVFQEKEEVAASSG